MCSKYVNSIILLIAALALQIDAQGDSNFLVYPYLQFATDSSITVMWETQSKTSTKVYYSQDTPLAHEISIPGMLTMHEVVISNLDPAAKYFYQVESVNDEGDTLKSELLTFSTAVDENTPVSFAIVSDTQTNPPVWGKISDLVWRERPQFVLHGGDIVGTGRNKDQWVNHFFAPAKDLMSRIPIYTVLGNHDGDDVNYYRYMHNPDPEYYYTFHYGNVQFFMIDTNHDYFESSDQYVRLEWDLANSKSLWKVVVHHHSPFSSDENDFGDSFNEKADMGEVELLPLVKLYEKYGVDMVFCGHIHDYERSWPIYENTIDQKKGVIYVQTGGAGGGLENYAPTRSWFTAKVHRDHHFCLVNIFDGTLNFQAIDQDWHLFDHFSITQKQPKIKSAELDPPAPLLAPKKQVFLNNTTVEIKSAYKDAIIYYTLDGSEPNENSHIYTQPIKISNTITLKACVVYNDKKSQIVSGYYEKAEFTKSVKKKSLSKGLEYKYYEGQWQYLPDFKSLNVVNSGISDDLDLDKIKQRDDYWGVVFNGFIHIPAKGIYTFATNSDDGTRLYIADKLVVDNDGPHSPRSISGQIALEKGVHPFKLEYFDDYGGEVLLVWIIGPDFEKQLLPLDLLVH